MQTSLWENKAFFISFFFTLSFLILVTIVFTYHSTQLPLWVDEWDTLSPSFDPWLGAQGFWAHLKRYNANPPLVNLIVRWFHDSGLFKHFIDAGHGYGAPELYWRFTSLAMFFLTGIFSFWLGTLVFQSPLYGTVWTGLIYQSSYVYEYATESRFYIWVVSLMALHLGLFFLFIRKPSLKAFMLLVAQTSLAILTHLIFVPSAYLILLGTLVCIGLQIKALRREALLSALRKNVHVLLIGSLPYLTYKFTQKKLVFIAGETKDFDINAFLGFFKPAIQSLILDPLPKFQGATILFYALLVFCCFEAMRSLRKKEWKVFSEAILLLTYTLGVSFLLYKSTYQRDYGLSSRHTIFLPVTYALGVAWVLSRLISHFSMTQAKRSMLNMACAASLLLYWPALLVAEQTSSSILSSTSIKIVYYLNRLRDFYKLLPEKRQLVHLGLPHPSVTHNSDLGGFLMITPKLYSDEFSPHYLSKQHGAFDASGNKMPELEERIYKFPEKYDFIVYDSLEKTQVLFPGIRWNQIKCVNFTKRYANGLYFCRIWSESEKK